MYGPARRMDMQQCPVNLKCFVDVKSVTWLTLSNADDSRTPLTANSPVDSLKSPDQRYGKDWSVIEFQVPGDHSSHEDAVTLASTEQMSTSKSCLLPIKSFVY